MRLNDSRVTFDPVKHAYSLDGVTLKGITSRIHEKLFPDEYADVPKHILQAAADRGHRIHTAVELYDESGIVTSDCQELNSYLDLREKHAFLKEHEASEYLVTDGKIYASAIDKVYALPDGVALVDIKTTYKLNMEYVSWQLSVYKYLFNLINPEIEVKAAYALWLRKEQSKLVKLPFHSEEEVKKLLYEDDAVLEASNTDFDEAILKRLKEEAEEATARYDAYKQELYERMVRDESLKMEGVMFTITRRLESERVTLDTKAIKQDYPEVYAAYTKVTKAKGGISIRAK